ncbi:MAG: hypothetical protein RR501_06040 [Cloacibacillus sp.]
MPPVLLYVDKYRPVRQFVQHLLRLAVGELPYLGRLTRGKGSDGKLGHQSGLFFSHQYF